MPTRRFEGPDLDTALARARAEVGNGARVLSAERVRSGGLGGFFAKERVEIDVETGAEPEPPAGADDAPAPTPNSLLDLVDLVSRAEHNDARAVVRPDRIETMRQMAREPVTEERSDRAVPPPPTVSTETSTFAEILERITAQSEGPPPAPEPSPAPHTRQQPDPATSPPADPAAAPGPAPVRLITAPAGVALSRPAVPTWPHPALPAMAALPAIAAPPAAETGPLARLGLPPELEPHGANRRESLIDQLARLPKPPPLPCTRGTVVAVVGPRGPAQHIARAVCLRLGADPSTIATLAFRRRRASDPELTSIEEVLDHRRAWRRRPVPTVAVIDAEFGRSMAWAAELLGPLEPTLVWGVVEAGRKVEDISAWSDDLGGLDALCLTDLDDTVSPASPLRTGVPVALLEGEPATPERWADVLLARLAS